MRTVTPQTLTLLNENRGTELIIILGIQWVKDGIVQLYSDQKINDQDYPYPTIIEISDFDTTQTISSINDSQSISVTLDDTDTKIKNIIDSNNIQKQPVSVYFLFKGLPLINKTLFFNGEISSPITWDEGARTLSFDILSNRESIDVGFSMEDGDFPSIPDEALGKAWPLIFGQVCNMPTVIVRSPRKGVLVNGEGIHDFTLHPRLCQARYITCPAEQKGEVGSSTIPAHVECSTSALAGGICYELPERTIKGTAKYGPELSCVVKRFEVICNLIGYLEQQKAFEHATLNISNGESFPQDTNITLNIGGAKFRGTFSGTTFTITDREHPDYADWDHQTCRRIQDRYYGPKRIKGDTRGWTKTRTGTAYRYTGTPITQTECDDQTTVSQESLGGPAESWEAYQDIKASDFHWCPAGSEVLIEEEKEILNIVSLLPGTVDRVAAYYKMPTGRQLLMEVPTDYYTVYNTNYVGYDVVEIGLEKNLSKYDDNWDDQLYVSFTSTIGPNPVDIIEWLIGKYTDYTVDAVSFAAVQAALVNYPCNFWLQERKNVLDLIQDIAYQSRCGVYIRNNIVFIKYLSVEPASVRTLTESNIIANTLKVKLTDSDNIVTKHSIAWKKTGAGIKSNDEIDLNLILKHNVNRYGIKEESHDYYTQNTYSTILKSATFWMIRDSNSWKTIEFDTPLTQLDIDVWDCITLNTAQFSSKCIVTSINYNWAENTIHFEVWTPILAGNTTPYIWAWPAAQNALETFPTPNDESQDAGYSFEITPPIDHILLGGGEATGSIVSTGDRNPSDLDDTLPTVSCEISDLVDLDGLDNVYEPVDYEIEAAKLDAATRMATNADDGTSYEFKDEEEEPEEEPDHIGCKYKICQTWIVPTMVTCVPGPKQTCYHPCGGPCSSSGCSEGVCTGKLFTRCWTFLSYGRAAAMKAFYESGLGREENWSCRGYCVGSYTPYGPPGEITIIPDPNYPDEECYDPDMPESEENQDSDYENVVYIENTYTAGH